MIAVTTRFIVEPENTGLETCAFSNYIKIDIQSKRFSNKITEL
ncbi:MAG: hypothetical protein Q4G16_07380 [Cruoricaptor ignavus]|nr:hypothetical protein [Cruoricaptor ignavus]